MTAVTNRTRPVPAPRAGAPPGQTARQAARDAALHAGPVIKFLARTGYAAKGVVYGLVGGLALLAAFTSRGETTGSKGAMRSLLDQSYGRVLLAVVAAGLAGYALWCFVRAIFDPERDGSGWKGLAKRALQFGKGVVHVGLVVAAVGMIRGTGGGGGEDTALERWTAWLMSFPAGIWLVAAAGATVAVYGANQLYKAWTTDLDDQLSLGRMSPAGARWTVRFSRFGMAARGVVFAVIGGFLITAALHSDPSEAIGVGGALQKVQEQRYGPVLLGIVALGLMSYGAYELIRARYRRIDPT